ncbi:hypothetical protein BSZ39_03115 [Bowdeniella nasicola]|uniref:histidine kinase n=1 Tax=Bowdeniella nasicola TaxID=208480 RepID=A0A1Q5Q476_9ACTO|nr:sensor histidine kinase [Bowdeniella nasicola]OKL54603.1 hypothetical protein BSZ39_03115 [Bowdeniella nasicola]
MTQKHASLLPGRTDILLAFGAFVTLSLPVMVGGASGAFETALNSTMRNSSGPILHLVCLLMPLATAFRRTLPATSAAVIYVSALTHFAAGIHLLPADLLVLSALYSVVLYGSKFAQILGITGAYLGAIIIAVWSGTLSFGDRPRPINGLYAFLGGAGAVTMTWSIALTRRLHQREIIALAEHNRALQEERDQEAELATTAERNRIAREMHDIVAHSLSVMIAQADGGRYAAQAQPEAAVTALETIGQVGRDALSDMRKILGVLRGETGDESPRLPQPVDSDLDELITQMREAGLDISLVRIGVARPLPPGAGYAIYRICQEALTNCLKHAGPQASVTVVMQWLNSSVELKVDDDGRGAGALSDGKGQGLVGMRERAGIFGGSLSAGPRQGGGFRVHLQLPVPAAAPPTPALGVALATGELKEDHE